MNSVMVLLLQSVGEEASCYAYDGSEIWKMGAQWKNRPHSITCPLHQLAYLLHISNKLLLGISMIDLKKRTIHQLEYIRE